MKTSNVNLGNLLDQLSDERINRVVDTTALKAGGGSCDSCSSSSSGSSKSKSSKSKSSRSSKGKGHGRKWC